ncbi:MAG: protein-glutamate O-methyltransferase CheR [Acidobacteria bacterium]|nr:protein-glutamate O-methyltransferase CheR [Acidobacteriota bacterium]
MPVLGEDLVLTDREMQRIAALVYERSGITLHDGKKPLVVARLQKRLRALSLGTFAEYLAYLERDRSGDELVLLLDSIATNHTYFFREEQHFTLLAETVVPKFRRERRPMDIWCAASSTGEEPYTIGMTLSELDPPMDFRMVASDISTKALKAASAGVYKLASVEKLPTPVLRRYFEKGLGESAGFARVRRELRSKIDFRHINLLEVPTFDRKFDVIFCRNVMIYFDRAVQQRVVSALERNLRPGGYLFISHSESLNGITHRLRWVAPAAYQLEAL